MSPTFNFKTNYVLEDGFVQLRPLQKEDYDLLLPFALHEPEIWKYSLKPAAGAAGWKSYLDSALAAREEKKEYPFLVFDKRQQKYAGSTRFYDIQLDNQTLQLGYTWYGKDFRGTGLNKHCKYLLLEFAFEKMEAERVEFRADYANKRSIAAMQSLGCMIEGVLRNHLPKYDGSRRDSIILSILKDEWFTIVKAALQKKLI